VSAKLLIYLVDLVGIEPTTSSMPWKRAPKLRHRPTLQRQLFYCLWWGGIRQLRLGGLDLGVRDGSVQPSGPRIGRQAVE
jgi:hypothetical protein